MRGFKENNNLQIEKNNTALGKQPKRFDLLQQRANIADASLSPMKLRNETLTSVERIQLQREWNKVDSRQVVQRSRMYNNEWDEWQAKKYGTEEWEDCAKPHGDQAGSSHSEGVQVLSDSDDDAPQASTQQGQGDQAGSSHQSDQTKKYDKDYASMTQEERGRELAKKLYERIGKYDRHLKNHNCTDIRSFILNTGIQLDQAGYDAACDAIPQTERKIRMAIWTNIKSNYAQKGVYRNTLNLQLD